MIDTSTIIGLSGKLSGLKEGVAETLRKTQGPEKVGVLEVMPANEWMEKAKNQPEPTEIFGEFWFLNEVCILFSDTNTGKSVLAVQIAQSLATGESINGFPNNQEPMNVLLLDFELSEKQFEKRYSVDFKDHYSFNPKFKRVVLGPDMDYIDSSSFEKELFESIKQLVLKENAQVVIIDNLTYIKNETDKAKDAAPLMKKLKELKTQHNLSLLVLAHTPKLSEYREISTNDVSGSKALMNFADSAFAIGKSRQGSDIRYLKQVKVRSAEHRYGTNNVVVCRLEKVKNFLQFSFMEHSNEHDHLKQIEGDNKGEIIEQARALKETGMTNVEIGRHLGIAESTVRKYLNR